MKCQTCPLNNKNGSVCDGEEVPRLCQLRDPDHPDYDSSYRPNDKHEDPSLLTRASNFGKAVVDFVQDGFALVDEKTKQERLTQCKTCHYYRDGWCSHESCGCYLEAKTKIASQECPIGRWSSVPGHSSGAVGGCSSCGS